MWHDLRDVWDRLCVLGCERDEQKGHYSSCRNLSQRSTNVLGLLAEEVVARETGLSVDEALRPEGDDGYDFEHDGLRVDVKGTAWMASAHLIVDLGEEERADYFVLVRINWEGRRGVVVGHCTSTEIKHGLIKDFGYGKRRALHENELAPGLPLELQKETNYGEEYYGALVQ